MPDIAKALAHLFPNAQPLIDYEVWQEADGSQHIAVWNLPDPQPTAQQIADAALPHGGGE